MICLFALLFAIRMPKCFHRSDYEKLAKKYHCLSQSVCLVYNIQTGVQLTGVLIDERTVLTAAHGFSPKHAHFHQSGWKVKFPNGSICGIALIQVPESYVEIQTNPSSKFGKIGYDMAFCTLSSKPRHVCPVSMTHDHEELNDEDLLIAMTYRDSKLLAFHLPEFTSVHASGVTDATGYIGKIYGSVFFNPAGKASANNPFLEEKEQRPSLARYYWNHHGKPPYAMALPGVSGSPVFKVDARGCGHVIALVSGFSSVDKSMQIPYRNAPFFAEWTSLKNLYDQYQTLFVMLNGGVMH
ncbi:MAG: hypothetical protein AAB323_00650 [Pseudomonadota bacterium]